MDDCSTEVTQALVFVFMHDIELACKELLPQLLCRTQVDPELALVLGHGFLPDDLHDLSGVHLFGYALLQLPVGDLCHLLILSLKLINI